MDFFEVANYVDECDMKQWKSLNILMRERFKRLSNETKFQFHAGDKVQFNGRAGRKQVGTVLKIMQKNIKVKVDLTTWTVAPSLLEKVS